MAAAVRGPYFALALAAGALGALPGPLAAQSSSREGIADLINKSANGPELAQTTATPAIGAKDDATPVAPPVKDPRAGQKTYEQARQLMQAIDAVLKETAQQRVQAQKLPGKDEFIVTPLWTETREDRERYVRNLLDSALGIVTDVPIVELQKKVEGLKRNIHDIEGHIAALKEKQITAPTDGMLPGVLTDTVDSLGSEIADAEKRIVKNQNQIEATKGEIATALSQAGVELKPEQVDLLLDSVLSGDLVRLVAVFNAAKAIDSQLGKLLAAAGDNMSAARKYFAMHAALFAMLVHAQDSAIAKIDTKYMPKLDAILKDIEAAQAKTRRLLKSNNRPDQRRALEANWDAQRVAHRAAKGYRRYLQQQREQIARARTRATHDLRIADNTYETVEASFQLKRLMRDSAASFDAIQKLEAPTFDQIFKNEELRREFENLTRKLDEPTS